MSARAVSSFGLLFAAGLAACSPAKTASNPSSSTAAVSASSAPLTDAKLDGDLSLFGKGTLWTIHVTGPDHAIAMTRPMFEDVHFAKATFTKSDKGAEMKAAEGVNDIDIKLTKATCNPGLNYEDLPISVVITFKTDESKQEKTFEGCGGPGMLPAPGKL